jgi:hypothetical protein
MSKRSRMQKYCQGLNDALCEAIGHYRATVELIVKLEVSGKQALELLEGRPVVDPPNVGEFNPTVTVWPAENGSLEDIIAVIAGDKALIEYIHGPFVRNKALMRVGGNAMAQVDERTWEVRLTLSVFNNLDAEVIENLRYLLSQP